MTIETIEEQISDYKRERQVHYETMMDAFITVQKCVGRITECNEVIETLLRREVEVLRDQLMIAQRGKIK